MPQNYVVHPSEKILFRVCAKPSRALQLTPLGCRDAETSCVRLLLFDASVAFSSFHDLRVLITTT